MSYFVIFVGPSLRRTILTPHASPPQLLVSHLTNQVGAVSRNCKKLYTWTSFKESNITGITMNGTQFPHPSEANEDGILAIGGELNISTLYDAYSNGIFPWPHEDYPLLWFCPWERGILEFQELHISRSLKKILNKPTSWHFTIDKDFSQVIRNCSAYPRPGQSGTWINEDMIQAYEKFYTAGYAHSFEVWDKCDLIGGLYGVFVKNVFSAESMFYKKSNASKWVFIKMIEYLKSLGLQWIDVQMVTPTSENFGAKLISQEEFLKKIQASHQSPLIPFR